MSNEVVPTCEANVLAIYQPTYTTNTKVKQKILEEEEYLSVKFFGFFFGFQFLSDHIHHFYYIFNITATAN